MHGKTDIPGNFITKGLSLEERKCGLGLVNSIKINLNRFTPERQAEINKLLLRPDLQTSIVSNSDKFRIHFDTTGNNVPSYNSSLTPYQNALEVGKAIDSAYNFEVNYLGYPPPPSDNGQGGDNLLDIYIVRIGPGYYGSTYWEDVINEANQTYTSYIEIDPAFGSGFYSHGLNGVRVTAAHELHHAIQIGNYTNRYDDDGFFYELTSTSMEEFVFDDVNDYYEYIKYYFRNPARSFIRMLYTTDGYDLAVWNLFLKKKFGYDIIRRQWELMPTMRALYAISQSLFEHNSSFTNVFNEFGIWMYFTGYRAILGEYFDEASEYPLIDPMSETQFSGSYSMVNISGKAASNIFLKYVIASKSDTLYTIISNGDVNSAINRPNDYFDIQYTLFSDSKSGKRFLTKDYSSTFTNDNPSFWSASEILNDLVVREDSVVNTYQDIASSFIFPNPFKYGKNNGIYISLNAKSGEMVDLIIYSVSMELMYKSKLEVTLISKNNSIGISWNGLDSYGNKLASGVYIYIIKKNDDIIKGKFVVFN